MANLSSALDTQLFPVASYLMKVDMFPVFFAAHFAIACHIVRDDSKDLGKKFRQNHPFAGWFCTVMTGLSGVFVANFLFGDPLIDIMKENKLIVFITIVWYLMNYSPFDIVYTVVMSPPVIICASLLQECLRVRFIYLGLQQAAKVYPNAHIIIILGGAIKGNGYGFIKIVERLIRGKWTPTSNEILEVTYFAKSGLYASILFLLHHIKVLEVSIEYLYLGIILAFIFGRMMVILGVKDPLLPLETPLCAMLFGSGGDDKGKKAEEKVEKEKTEKEKKEKKTK